MLENGCILGTEIKQFPLCIVNFEKTRSLHFGCHVLLCIQEFASFLNSSGIYSNKPEKCKMRWGLARAGGNNRVWIKLWKLCLFVLRRLKFNSGLKHHRTIFPSPSTQEIDFKWNQEVTSPWPLPATTIKFKSAILRPAFSCHQGDWFSPSQR